MMRPLCACVCLRVWVSALSLCIESSPAAHIITQTDTEHCPDETLLGHEKTGTHRIPPQRRCQHRCVFARVYKDVLCHVHICSPDPI